MIKLTSYQIHKKIATSHIACGLQLQAELGEAKERIVKYTARLREVRVRRAAMQAAMDEGADGEVYVTFEPQHRLPQTDTHQ